MGNKIKKIFSIVLIGIMVGAIPATAGTINWDGNQGINNVRQSCTPGEQPYLHWILNDVDNTQTYSLNLILEDDDGNMVDEDSGERAGNSGTYHFYTGFFDLAGLTAYVNNVPGGNNLVISDGCSGEAQIPEFPTVALPIAAIIGLVFLFQQRKLKGDK